MKIGNKIKQLRVMYGLTQEELADRCELSKGFISMVENDLTSPSISTMQDLLEVLGMSISEFFESIEDYENEKVVYKKNDYYVNTQDSCTIEYLIPDAQVKEMEPLKVIINPGGSSEEILPHEGDMFGYVLSGRIKLKLDNKEYELKSGDSFYYSKPISNQVIINKSTSKIAEVLWLSTPPVF